VIALSVVVGLMVAWIVWQERTHRADRAALLARLDALHERLWLARKEGFDIPPADPPDAPESALDPEVLAFLSDYDEAGQAHYRAKIAQWQRDGHDPTALVHRLLRDREEMAS
jgi:hypothetical protein